KYQRHEKAEAVLAKVVARGGDGNDWLALGVAQLAQEMLEKAEGTLKGAQNLMKDNPYPSLHLAKLSHSKTDAKAERDDVERSPADPIPLIVLSALYGQAGKIEEVVKLLAPHEALMQQDVRIAHNNFEALFQAKDMGKITALLNKLATSSNKEVKQFAIER